MANWQLDHWKQTSVKCQWYCNSLPSRKCIWRCFLRNGNHFVQASNMLTSWKNWPCHIGDTSCICVRYWMMMHCTTLFRQFFFVPSFHANSSKSCCGENSSSPPVKNVGQISLSQIQIWSFCSEGICMILCAIDSLIERLISMWSATSYEKQVQGVS